MYYLKIATAKNDEPYVLLMCETLGGPTETDLKVMWSETYRSLSGAKNLVRVLREGRTIWQYTPGDHGPHVRVVARNRRILMSGSIGSVSYVTALVVALDALDWPNIEVRDER